MNIKTQWAIAHDLLVQRKHGLETHIIRFISAYSRDKMTEFIIKILLLYDDKFKVIASRSESYISKVNLIDLLQELKYSNNKSILLYSASFPYVNLSFSYYQMSLNYFADGSSSNNRLMWTTAYASCIYYLIESLTYDKWENLDRFGPLAKSIDDGFIDEKYWSLTGCNIGYNQYLDINRPNHQSTESMVWNIMLDHFANDDEVYIISNCDDISRIWLENNRTPLASYPSR